MFYQYPALGEEHIFQEFCKDVFNQIYKTNDFQLYKTKGSAQHGIDSYSAQQQIVIQSKKKKLLRSDRELEKELQRDLNETIGLVNSLPFTFKLLIFATNTKKYGLLEDLAATLSQSHSYQVKFFSWEDFEPEITKFPVLRKTYFPEFCQLDNTYPKILSRLPYIDKSTVIGRANDLENIQAILSNSNKTVLINGMGGIGKTTLLKLVLTRIIQNYDHILWIDYSGTQNTNDEEDQLIKKFTENIPLLINLNIDTSLDLSHQEILAIINNKLSNISGQNLLVIDNAPKIYAKISQNLFGPPNWKVLVSSREKIVGTQQVEITFLDIKESLSLFYQYYKLEVNDFIVSEILSRLGFHTLTIELLAKTANRRRIRLDELQLALEKEGLNISKSAKVTSAHDPSQTPSNHFTYLLSIFSISYLNDAQKELLTILSILPFEFISYDNLKLIYNVGDDDNDFFDTINIIAEAGWLIQNDDQYQMHQVIQEVIRAKLKLDEYSCRSLVINLTNMLSVNFNQNPYNVKKLLYYTEYLLAFIVNKTIDLAELYNTLGLRNEDFNNLEKALSFYHKAEAIYKTSGDDNLPALASVYNNLQSVYKTLGKIDIAFNYQSQALAIQEKVLHPADFSLATSYNNIALLYEIKGDLYNALKFIKRALAIAEYFLEDDHPYLASTYSNLANLLHRAGDYEQAFNYQKKAYEMRLRILEEDHPQIDESRNNMATMYHARGQLDLAEDMIRESIVFKERVYGPDSFGLGTAYNNLAAIYLTQKRLNEAEIFQLKAIQLEENGLGKNHPEVATSYSTLAVIKSAQRKFDDGIFYAQKSIGILRSNFPEGHPAIDMCTEFIRITRIKMTQVSNKTGRNQLCPCGSKKKYKACCGK